LIVFFGQLSAGLHFIREHEIKSTARNLRVPQKSGKEF